MRAITTIFATLLIVAVCTGCVARRSAGTVVESTSDPRQDEQGISLSPDEPPQFPGGQEALNQFLSENLVRPAVPNLQGRVFVQFVVGVDGSINDIEIVQSLSPAHDQEVIRVVQAMPNWIPGTVNGEPVRVTLPVRF